MNKKVVIAISSVAVAVLLLVGGYCLLAYSYSGVVSANTKIAGVQVGGKTATEATAVLKTTLEPKMNDDVSIRLGEKATDLNLKQASITPDYKTTVIKATEFSLNPKVLYKRIKGNEKVALELTYGKGFKDYLTKLKIDLDTPAVEPTVAFRELKPVMNRSAEGLVLSQKEFKTVLSNDLFVKNIVFKGTKTKSKVSDAEANEVIEHFAKPLVSAPMYVQVESDKAEITPEVLAANTSFVIDDAKLKPVVDGEKIREAIQPQLQTVTVAASDAKIVLENGVVHVIDSVDGKNISAEALSENIMTKANQKNREFELSLQDQKPSFTTEDANKLGVKEVVSEYMIPITGEAKRLNLINGANKINNTLLKPNDTFSYQDIISPVTQANGYVQGLAIIGDSYGYTVGGGLCQLATTVYNAAYYSGMDIIERHPHSEYFSVYPIGMDSAFWEDGLNLVFKNTTPYGVLIQAYVENNNLYVKFFSTKYYDVKTSTGSKYNIVPAKTTISNNSNCVPSNTSQAGFSIDVTRERYLLDGSKHDSQTFKSVYKPTNIVKCAKDIKREEEQKKQEEQQRFEQQEQGGQCTTSGCQ